MRRLPRYIARRVWFSVLLVLLVVVGLDSLAEFLDESADRSSSYGYAQIARYVLLTLPGRIYEYLPFAALIGALTGLGQLASTSELVVMRAAGVSNARLATLVLLQSLQLALLGFLLGEYLAPGAEQAAQSGRDLARYAQRERAGPRGIWKRDGDRFIHVQAVQGGSRIFGVTVYEFAGDGRLERALFADQGRYRDGGWLLREVRWTRGGRERYRRGVQASLFLASNLTPRVLTLENVEPEQLALNDLVGYADFLRTQGEDAGEFELALWRKLLQPAAVAALVLVALSFVFGPLRDGSLGFRLFAGVMVGIVFRLAEELLGPASLVFGFAPFYAALAPVLLCALAGLLLLRRAG